MAKRDKGVRQRSLSAESERKGSWKQRGDESFNAANVDF